MVHSFVQCRGSVFLLFFFFALQLTMQAVAQEKHDNIAHVDFTLEQLDEYMNKPDTSLRWAKRMDYSQVRACYARVVNW